MRITGLGVSGVEPRKSASRSGSRAHSARSDAVELSQFSLVLSGSGPQAAALDELHLEVQAGRYDVPATELAHDLVEHHLG